MPHRPQSWQLSISRFEKARVLNDWGTVTVRLADDHDDQEPGDENRCRHAVTSHFCPVSSANTGRSFAAVVVNSSGMTLVFAITGMKFVSPFQRGTT